MIGILLKSTDISIMAVIVSAVLALLLWSSFALTRTELRLTTTIDPGDGVILRLEPNRTSYAIGEPVGIRMFERNNRDEPVQGGISEIDVTILGPDGKFIGGIILRGNLNEDFKIRPGQEIELMNAGPSWSQRDADGEQVPPGVYTVKIDVWNTTVNLDVTIKGA